MIDKDELTNTTTGSGYVIGKLKNQHKKLYYLKENALVVYADGLDTLLDMMQEHMPDAKREESSSEKGTDGGFHAFKSYEYTMELFRGSPEKVAEFNATELRIRDTEEAGTIVDYEVVGDYIDMGRHLEGIPESWGSMHNGNARNRRININIDLGHAHYISHKVIQHRAERVLRLVDALEAGGVRCRLVGIESNECSHLELTIKEHSESLAVNDLAVAIHPEFLRRIIFRVNEQSDTWKYGYGSSVVFRDTVNADMLDNGNVNELDILIAGNFNSNSSVDVQFDKLERLLVWELSKPVPELTSVKMDEGGIYFVPNGYRSNDEIKREGREAIDGKYI